MRSTDITLAAFLEDMRISLGSPEFCNQNRDRELPRYPELRSNSPQNEGFCGKMYVALCACAYENVKPTEKSRFSQSLSFLVCCTGLMFFWM